MLYNGPVEAGLAFLPDKRELADLWWPADRAWFVYGDVDLTFTYVGGSAALVDGLLVTTELEAVRVDPTNPIGDDRHEHPDWLADRVEAAVRSLLATVSAVLSTSRFTVRFELGAPPTSRLPVRFELGAPSAHPCQTEAGWGLRYHSDTASEQSGWTSLRRATDLPAQLRHVVTCTVINLVEP